MSEVLYVWGCWGQPMLLFQKLVLIIKISTSQNFKTTFNYNLICIFLSLRTKLKKELCPRTPCRWSWNKFLDNISQNMALLGSLTVICRIQTAEMLPQYPHWFFFVKKIRNQIIFVSNYVNNIVNNHTRIFFHLM